MEGRQGGANGALKAYGERTVPINAGQNNRVVITMGDPVPVDDHGTPIPGDYTFGNMTQTAGGTIDPVTITKNEGASPGAVSNIQYENGGTWSPNVPQTAGTYAVRFDVVAVTGWNAASGLSAGFLTVNDPALGILSGTITITPSSPTVGTAMTATYTGPEAVSLSYQWKNGTTDVGTNSATYTPTATGSYTVTISASSGYNPMTSAVVTVGPGTLSGTITITNTGTIYAGATLTANYTGGETVTYQWNKGTAIAGATGSTYMPTTAGSYTVTVSASGYNNKTSATVMVVDPLQTWTAGGNSQFGTNSIEAIAYGGPAGQEKFVAVGYENRMAYSSNNGQTWTVVGTASTFGTNSIYNIAYGGGRFVAVGTSGHMAYSSSGTSWTTIGQSLLLNFIYAIAYIGPAGQEKFFAGGSSGMAYSTDGINNWTKVANSPFSSIRRITYGNGKFVTTGTNTEIAWSTDGINNWTVVADTTFGTNEYIRAIAYGGGKFVAVGNYGKMAWSTDAITWTAVTDSTFGSTLQDGIHAIAYGGGKFVAVGASGKMAWSIDGITWTAITNSTFGTTEAIWAITYANNRFIAGGASGKTAYSVTP